MVDVGTIRSLLEYTDWSTRQLLECSSMLSDEALDRDLEIGPGTLRRILLHTYNGEHVWLKRWQGSIETKWPSESETIGVQQLIDRYERLWVERDGFLAMLPPGDAALVETYRDSKGSMFRATMGEMLLQGVLHTKHHQAQACNALRRLGAKWPELDYMMHVRRPA